MQIYVDLLVMQMAFICIFLSLKIIYLYVEPLFSVAKCLYTQSFKWYDTQ